MRLLAASTILAIFSAISVSADTGASPTTSSPSATTPLSAVTDGPNLELRQVGLVDPDAALTGVAGAGAVTNYGINSQIGPGVGTQINVVYTQLFSKVPDQCTYTCDDDEYGGNDGHVTDPPSLGTGPSPKPGTIGLGDLARRDLDAAPTLDEEARPIQTGIAGRIRR